MGYLRRVLGVTLRDKGHRSEIGEARVVKPLLRIERYQLLYVGSVMCPECPGKDWRITSFGLQSTPTEKRPRVRPRTRWRDYISDLAWSRLGVEPAENYLRLLLIVRYLRPPRAGISNLGWMYPWGYICLSEGVHLRLEIEGKDIFTCYLFSNLYTYMT